ncbi:MAG TPA: HAD family hydrolase [Leptolyngbyaceae cyanobacterium M33_DOE_097]|uniref:HAD family hydrolase n=1 Tax=Oscillatoriales cyanobacterium SpSt-418 TaxID=2282169 RepID=A0A7C3PLE0_9CYAN|nr:HAD family hydrolase [Leptolyngbyaceae cyanobacterium M33_DOE_097]
MAGDRKREKPTVIFLDAVGTLFGVQGSVGHVYREVAQSVGVEVDPIALNKAFYQCFKAAGLPAFGVTDPITVRQKEYDWWKKIAIATFKQAGALPQFADFDGFFAQLYHHFSTTAPWFVYPDVRPALQRWRDMEIQLGILSNFDSRLYAVLDALELSHFFTSVTISTEVGAAKPDAQIFQTALQKHLCQPEWAWHIGDRFDEDYQAARAAGLRGIWLRRKETEYLNE